jgi:hypothetical protein
LKFHTLTSILKAKITKSLKNIQSLEELKQFNGDDYFEFNFDIYYRPHIKSREEKVGWTDYHALEDLGK